MLLWFAMGSLAAATLVAVRWLVAGPRQLVDARSELGYVRYGPDGVPAHATLIKRARCQALASYLRSDKEDPDRDEIVAVHILSHEARHMAGTVDEARAECEAMQRDTYSSPGCRAGAELDEHLELAPWSPP